MRWATLAGRLSAGAAAGLANTFALQGILKANQRFFPSALAPIRQDPGRFMVERAEAPLSSRTRGKVPRTLEAGAAGALHLGYGMTCGLMYGLLGPRRRTRSVAAGGAALGLAVWAAGYAGWLPAVGLMPPLREQEAPQIAGPIVTHLVFGIGTAATYDLLRRWLSD